MLGFVIFPSAMKGLRHIGRDLGEGAVHEGEKLGLNIHENQEEENYPEKEMKSVAQH